MSKVKNPLRKRIPRELKGDFGKYLVIFIFMVGMIGIVSGFLVANQSISNAYDESFQKYNIEDGNFELASKADSKLIDTLEKEDVKIYDNFYVEEETKEVDSTLRVFANRTDIDRACIMEGRLAENKNEIAIDRMYAENNNIKVGDTLTVGNKKLNVVGLIALSDYKALFSNTTDMMFDAVKFGVATVTDRCFDSFGDTHLHYNYSWKYDNPPKDDNKAKDMGDDFLEVLAKNAIVKNYIPEYTNQAIIFVGDDMTGDNAMITVFLYIVIVIIAFVFAITSSNSILKESTIIGTLRASGYSKGELVRHYMTAPLIVMLAAAIIGNILGYTFFKDYMAQMYYGSYSLPTFETCWNAEAFVKTTIVPLIIMFLINLFVLSRKLSISPLKFIRRDLSRRKKKKAIRLNTKIGIMSRFRLRIIFQNIPNYITIFIGILFANLILLFGLMFGPLLDNYQNEITSNLICENQYILKAPQKTDTKGAEKYCVTSLDTTAEGHKIEGVTVYGVKNDSKYVDINIKSSEKNEPSVFVSNAYAEKHGLKKGDVITLKEEYGNKKYRFTVQGVYYYPSTLAVFMKQSDFNEAFDPDSDYFNGYFSDLKIKDIDDDYIATVITQDDLTKTSRQLKVSMGSNMTIFLVFGIAMFILIIYLLSKIIIEKNSQSISMTKILGYRNGEINLLYVTATTIVVVLSILLTIPIADRIIGSLCVYIFSDYSGWLPYYVPWYTYIEMFILGIVSYAVVAFMQMYRVKRIPMTDALKNNE